MQTAMIFAGTGASIVLLAIAVMHVLWALGVVDSSRAVPSNDLKPLFKPTRSMTLGVAVALLVAAAITFGCIGFRVPGIPSVIYKAGIWTLTAVFFARAVGEFKYIGFFKTVRDTSFGKMDTLIYTPLCASLCAAFFFIALNMTDHQ